MIRDETELGLVVVDSNLLDKEPVAVGRHITVLAFRNRFTRSEKVRIELAALDNPSGTLEQRQLAATVRVGQADLLAASFVDLDREDTRADVQNFELMELLDGEGRALEILDAPIQDREKYPG